MAKRSTRNLPLEWKTDTINTTDATVTNGLIDLDLTQDEIAEILVIDSTIVTAHALAASDTVYAAKYMSMDPDATATPATLSNYEDLEVFFSHYYQAQSDYAEATESGGWGARVSDHKMWNAPDKYGGILVGTNVSQVVVGDAAIACGFITTVYFKRRKATARELNQILLKRR